MKYNGPKIKKARRLGVALSPKSEKFLERRPNPPGQHGPTRRRGKQSDYGRQLTEKQRLRYQYNMSEKQSNDGRRKLLKSIALGSGAVVAGKSMPENWTKPVVDSVMLPAHAETTDSDGSLPVEPTCTDNELLRIVFTRPGSSNYNAANVITSTSFYVGEGDAGTNYITAFGFFADAPNTAVYINALGNLLWSTSDAGIAHTGSGPGTIAQQSSSSITAVGVGTATITATYVDCVGQGGRSVSGSYTVTVTPAPGG